jgi:hypothetical protein
MLLIVCWSCGCLRPDVVVLTCGWSSYNKSLLSMSSSVGIGVLSFHALCIRFAILRWYICRDDQELAI